MKRKKKLSYDFLLKKTHDLPNLYIKLVFQLQGIHCYLTKVYEAKIMLGITLLAFFSLIYCKIFKFEDTLLSNYQALQLYIINLLLVV